jgi:uncharacterized membrane protein
VAGKLPRLVVFVLALLMAFLAHAARAPETALNVNATQLGETITVDATLVVAVSLDTAWEVLTDFDHMTSILGNLTSSEVLSRNGNLWIIRQKGVARYGFLSFPFESDREIHLEPMKRILARNLSGTLKRMDSEANLVFQEQAVQLRYHAEIVPDSLLGRFFGATFVRHEVEEQLQKMAAEMKRREVLAKQAQR